ncbi:MAG: outer membrane protein assembly factor BamE [Gammaproteobacteria bacterium]|jgi:outer membrane protein assembly factor BamE
MQKPLLICLYGALVAAAGCSSVEKATDSVVEPVSGWSLVHKPTIQQGTPLSQRQLDQVQIGMSREEVRQELGTPSLTDVFHQERWDYIYWLKVPGSEPVLKTLTLHFDNGYLDRITGDYEAEQDINDEEKRVVVDVPDYKGKGLFSRTLDKIGFDSNN